MLSSWACSSPSSPRRQYEDGEDVADEADAAHGEGEDAVAPVAGGAPGGPVGGHVLQRQVALRTAQTQHELDILLGGINEAPGKSEQLISVSNFPCSRPLDGFMSGDRGPNSITSLKFPPKFSRDCF